MKEHVHAFPTPPVMGKDTDPCSLCGERLVWIPHPGIATPGSSLALLMGTWGPARPSMRKEDFVAAFPQALTFAALRHANVHRLPEFRDAKGRICHRPDGSDWALSAWSNACLGELGEAANLIKKVERGDLTLEEAREALGKELADVQTYLDILAFRAGVDLGEATRKKFNEVSVRVGSQVRL